MNDEIVISVGMEIDPKRFLKRRLKLKLSQGEVATRAGMRQQGIASIESGEVKRPRRLRELAQALETTEDYLLRETDEDALIALENIPVKMGIPISGEVAAGLWLEIGLPAQEPTEWLPFMPDMGWKPEATYAIRVRGNSVDKLAPHGSILICTDLAESGLKVKDNDLVVVEHIREQEGKRQVTVKRIRARRGGWELIPESTDPYWKPIVIRRDMTERDGDEEIRVIARVEWIAQRPSSK